MIWEGVDALFGGAVAGAVSALMVDPVRERSRIWSLSNSIQLQNFMAEGTTHYRLQVRNTGAETIRDAIAYLTLRNEPRDIVKGCAAYEAPGHPYGVRDGRLCWALGGNPHKIDIFPGERQLLNFAKVERNGGLAHIVIASESGFGDSECRPARVCLQPKRYDGEIRLVASNILARVFSVEIAVSQGHFGSIRDPRAEKFVKKYPFLLGNSIRMD